MSEAKRLIFFFLSLIIGIYFVQCTAFTEKSDITPAQPPRKVVKPIKTWQDPITGMEFVWVPGGCYEMGCGPWTKDCFKQEFPLHEVCVDGFWLGKYEVTQGQWKQLMGYNHSLFNLGKFYPVERVTWYETQRFIKKLNEQHGGKYWFRLPTEAEWEYAARSGGQTEMFSGGNNADAVAWYHGNSRESTHSVGKKAPNGLGLYDMSGNVWEWCQDLNSTKAYKRHAKNNPVIIEKASNHRVIKGGGWNDIERFVRCAQRLDNMPGVRDVNIGFRIVMKQKQEQTQ